MNIIEIIAQDVFDKVRSRFVNLEMGNEEGGVTTDPKDARFFDFDFVLEGHNLGRVSISINERGTLKIFYSQGITEGTDPITRGLWYDFLKEMRLFAKRRLMRFDTRDITKGNLNKDDFQYLAQTGSKGTDDMNESSMYGSSKTSYRKLENTRLILRHSKAVNEEQPGARSRNVSAMYIENSEGERFKYPYIHLAGAKAMQRHVANGGMPYDEAGSAIIKMSEQIAQLNTFKRHVNTGLLNDDAQVIHQRVGHKLEQLRDSIGRLQGQHGYEQWRENFTPTEYSSDLDPVTIEDYKNKFTVKQFDETLASVFPLIHAIMQEAGTVDLEDIVSEGEEEKCDECGMYESKCECEEEKTAEGFEKFEQWADAIVEGTLEPDTLMALSELLGQGITVGPDGSAGIEALQGIGINVEALEELITAKANIDPNTPLDDVVGEWLSVDDPEAAQELGLTGAQEEPAAPAPEAPPAEEPAPEVGGEIPSPVVEGDDLRGQLFDAIKTIYSGAVAGDDMIDNLADEVGQFYDKVEGSGDKQLQQAYSFMMDNGQEAEGNPEQMAQIARQAMKMLSDGQPVSEEEQMDNKEQKLEDPKPSLKELAEFIGAFYNPHAREQGLGEWRKGPTELGIMASKQFGDRAGKIVELMVTRMQEASAGDQQFAEVMKLAGIQVQQEGLKDVAKKVGGVVKKAAGKALDTLGHGSDDDLIKDLQKKVGAPQHGKKSMAQPNEGAQKEDFDVMLKLAGLSK